MKKNLLFRLRQIKANNHKYSTKNGSHMEPFFYSATENYFSQQYVNQYCLKFC